MVTGARGFMTIVIFFTICVNIYSLVISRQTLTSTKVKGAIRSISPSILKSFSLKSTSTSSDTLNLVGVLKDSLGIYRKSIMSSQRSKINGDISSLLSLSIDYINDKDNQIDQSENGKINLNLLQQTNGPVPRSYLPAVMVISSATEKIKPTAIYSLIEEALRWYLDAGGRSNRLEIACPKGLVDVFKSMNFEEVSMYEAVPDQVTALRKAIPLTGHVLMSSSSLLLKKHVTDRLEKGEGDPSTLYDIVGRLMHDLGDPKGAIKPYTAALQANANSAATFRNLGSAYHGAGDLQLAFASYQQAVQLDPTDAMVYLKLAFFYEDFATKDWVDAAEHSTRCYQYYLDNVDNDDTSVLTRLGNLHVREHKSDEAIKVYSKALSIDPSLHNVWFNKAHAQVKIGDLSGASESLQKTLEIDPTIIAARHMLIALSEDEAVQASSSDDAYIKDLFDSYAQIYDNHGKKLLYSAPRVIRQELAKIYRQRLGSSPTFGDTPLKEEESSQMMVVEQQQMPKMTDKISDFAPATEPVGGGCSTYTSFVNGTLDILDIGCGTGLAGAWLKDYAKTLVGVDLSEQMVNVARKKMLYQELHVEPMNKYMDRCTKTFDIVVAADVLSYVGDLSQIFKQVALLLRPGAHFAFTVETASPDQQFTERGYRLLTNGRFGYSKEYIDGLIHDLGGSFTVPLSREFSPRLDAGEAVPGYLYIIQKSDQEEKK